MLIVNVTELFSFLQATVSCIFKMTGIVFQVTKQLASFVCISYT